MTMWFGPTLHQYFFCAVSSQTYLDNIDYKIFLCNVVIAWKTQHCIGYFAKRSCLLTMSQNWTGKVLAQCWPTLIKIALQIIFLCKVVFGLWVNIAQVIFLCNVGTDRLRQHCIGYFPAKTYLHDLGQHCSSNFLMLSQITLDNID